MRKASSLNRRQLMSATVGAAAATWVTNACSAAGLLAPLPTGEFRPEQFGARGDGRTDDTQAFQLLSQAVSQAGRGTIIMRPRAIYRLGRQVATQGSADAAFAAEAMLKIDGVTGLRIQGNGATLKLNDKLRFGSFDPASGARFDPPLKGAFTKSAYAANVGNLIAITQSSDIEISDVTLDGNMEALVIGGRWGDTGIQLSATGLRLDRVSQVVIDGLVSRGNGLDGVYLRGRNVGADGGANDNIVLRNVRCDHNGRQGMSVVGGKGLRFEQCVFSNTGQGQIASKPRAGVDLEPNGQNWTTDAIFDDCQFINNRGVGLLADAGNSRDLTVRHCTFWQGFAPSSATQGSSDALWLGREGVQIADCAVHGTVTHMPKSAQIARTSFDNATHPVFGQSAQVRPYLLDSAAGSYTNCTFSVGGSSRQGIIFTRGAMVLQGCRLHYSGTGLPSSKAVAAFSPAAVLEDVTFSEGPAVGSSHFIADNGAQLVGKVTVTGPRVRWHGLSGPTGVVTALRR